MITLLNERNNYELMIKPLMKQTFNKLIHKEIVLVNNLLLVGFVNKMTAEHSEPTPPRMIDKMIFYIPFLENLASVFGSSTLLSTWAKIQYMNPIEFWALDSLC